MAVSVRCSTTENVMSEGMVGFCCNKADQFTDEARLMVLFVSEDKNRLI